MCNTDKYQLVPTYTSLEISDQPSRLLEWPLEDIDKEPAWRLHLQGIRV